MLFRYGSQWNISNMNFKEHRVAYIFVTVASRNCKHEFDRTPFSVYLRYGSQKEFPNVNCIEHRLAYIFVTVAKKIANMNCIEHCLAYIFVTVAKRIANMNCIEHRVAYIFVTVARKNSKHEFDRAPFSVYLRYGNQKEFQTWIW